MGTQAKGMATSHSRMAQSLLSLLQPSLWGLCSAHSQNQPLEQRFLLLPMAKLQVVTIL